MGTKEMIRVVTIKGSDVDFNVEFEHSLQNLQSFVGGYIEIPHISKVLYQNGIDMIINEEGKLVGLPTTAILTDGSKVCETIQGNILFASHDDEGNTIGLSDEQVAVLKDMFKTMAGVSGLGLVYNIPMQ